MKNLLFKEWKLVLHPTTFIFLSLGFLFLVPNYPFYVSFFYMCLSLFFLFLSGRENKDIFFTVSLPVRKRDVVRARCWTVALIELAQLLLTIPFALIRYNWTSMGPNLAGIEANVAFYGFAFGFFSVFNLLFLPGYYRTGYQIGLPFLFAGIGLLVYYVAVEMMVWIPSPLRDFLDGMSPDLMRAQLPILAGGILWWILSWFLACRISQKRFEKVDL
ncbi:MAG TPA: ABC-2 transporter permease [Candidatus Izemoplasmatales bacterium]|nr:ABC-2 transporter permease [Candidatus Izemoplasmatales bacterium]